MFEVRKNWNLNFSIRFEQYSFAANFIKKFEK